MSNLEILAVIVNVIGVWLTVRRNLWCWPVGIVGVLLYTVIFYQYKLYSDALLQVVFFYLQIYGWYHWKQNASEQKIVPLPLQANQAVTHLIVGALLGGLLGLVMARFTDAALPWVDSQLTAFSLVASLWAARKYVTSWVLWIIIDAIYVAMYQYKSLTLTAALYAGFVVLAAIGWYQWNQKSKLPIPLATQA